MLHLDEDIFSKIHGRVSCGYLYSYVALWMVNNPACRGYFFATMSKYPEASWMHQAPHLEQLKMEATLDLINKS